MREVDEPWVSPGLQEIVTDHQVGITVVDTVRWHGDTVHWGT